MVAAISDSITACLNTFNEFIEDVRHVHVLNELGAKGLVVGAWEDELGRLRIWAANIGAHQTGQSFLDFRLRDASHIREQIVKLLQSLLRKIQDARDVLIENEGGIPVARPGQSETSQGKNEGRTDPEEDRSNKAFTYPNPILTAQAHRTSSLSQSGYGSDRINTRSPSNKRHKCPYCSTDFTRHHNLKSHLLTHSHEKPYQCDTCEARFRRLHDLKRHTKLHTDERSHVCPKCDRSFARGDALARHKKGQGGCAGRRSSMGILGGDERHEERMRAADEKREERMRAGDGDGMPGIMYTDDNDEEMDDVVDQEEPETEIQELQANLTTTINCLFEMSMLVRKPASHDIYIGSKTANVTAFEPSDYRYVKERYARADDALVKRLGNAVTRRRKYLDLRERRSIQLREGIGNVYLGESDFTDLQCQTFVDEDACDKDIPHMSTTSALPTVNKLAVPPPPESSLAGAPFECPYCFYLITVHGSRSWTEHVFQDLQPYICVAPTCTSPDKLYPTRHEWLHHSNMIYPAGTIAQSKSKTNTGFVACPLCKEKLESGKQFDRHVARHLQDLALVLLPNSERRSDVEEYQDSDSTSSAESIDIATSDDRLKRLDSLPGSPVEHHLPAHLVGVL